MIRWQNLVLNVSMNWNYYEKMFILNPFLAFVKNPQEESHGTHSHSDSHDKNMPLKMASFSFSPLQEPQLSHTGNNLIKEEFPKKGYNSLKMPDLNENSDLSSAILLI